MASEMGYTVWPDGPAGDVIEKVYRERLRQSELMRAGKFKWTCAILGIPYDRKLAVLAEEFGEVSKQVVEHGITADKYKDEGVVMPRHRERYFRERLRKELIQVAAVCVAWVESLDQADEE